MTNPIADAARMVRYWSSVEVLHHLNMSEGFTLAALFASLGEDDTASHIIREVWEGEDDACRDPLPWANGHGSRKTETAVSYEDRYEREGDERFTFDPRLDYEAETAYCPECSAPDVPPGITCTTCGKGVTAIAA